MHPSLQKDEALSYDVKSALIDLLNDFNFD